MKHKVLFFAYATIIFLAYLQPFNDTVFTPSASGKGQPFWVQTLYLSTWIAPILPLAIAGFVSMGVHYIPATLAKLCAAISAVAGIFLTLASGVFSLFSETQVVHGISLTIAVSSSFLVWSGSDGNPKPSWLAKIGVSIGTVAALWSLVTVPMIQVQAHIIAKGSPFCIAHHSPRSKVDKLYELRGFSFYTEATGYKSTSDWFFHGLMIVDHPDAQRIYNWSPRRWRFDLVERPDAFVATVRNVCIPT
ncbi:MAG: hypothetical protein AAFX90_16860 [Pseudomonadota bacterium]